MSAVVARTGNCLPVSPAQPYGPTNFPTCILGQIYYDGAPVNNINVAVDDQSGAGFPCPDPSTTAPSGVSGTGVVLPEPMCLAIMAIIAGFGGAVSLAGSADPPLIPTPGTSWLRMGMLPVI